VTAADAAPAPRPVRVVAADFDAARGVSLAVTEPRTGGGVVSRLICGWLSPGEAQQLASELRTAAHHCLMQRARADLDEALADPAAPHMEPCS